MNEDRFEHLMRMRIRHLNHQLQQQRYISRHLTDALLALVYWDATTNSWRFRPSVTDKDLLPLVGHLLSID